MFKLGRILRRAGTPCWLAARLPRAIWSGWVAEELIVNVHHYGRVEDDIIEWDHVQ